MDLTHKLLAGAIGILVLGGIAGAIEHVAVREEKARLEERQKGDAALMAQKDAALQAQKDDLKKATDAFEQFKKEQVAATAAMEQRFTQAQTAQQNALLSAQLLGLKAGDVKVGGTAAAPTLEIPVAKQKEYEQACEDCKLKLVSASESLRLATQKQAVSDASVEDLQAKVKTLTKERDDALKLGAGGSTWTRLKHDGKAGTFGAAIAAVLLALTGHLK